MKTVLLAISTLCLVVLTLFALEFRLKLAATEKKWEFDSDEIDQVNEYYDNREREVEDELKREMDALRNQKLPSMPRQR